jgi:hypothetical protein
MLRDIMLLFSMAMVVGKLLTFVTRNYMNTWTNFLKEPKPMIKLRQPFVKHSTK